MIAAAALCPAAPLLVRELTGADPAVPELRAACLAAVAELVAAAPDVIAVVGAADQTATWDGALTLDMAVFAPGTRPDAAGQRPSGSLPSALGVGAWLLGRAGYHGPRVLESLAGEEPAGRCAAAGAQLAGLAERVSLLVMADGSARRTLRAPGYLDERSAGFDAGVERAVADGRLDALLALDAGLAAELMATGRPAWQALAGAVTGRRVRTEIRYSDAPFGVGYLVASVRLPEHATEGDGDG